MARMDASGHDRRFIIRALGAALACGALAASARAAEPEIVVAPGPRGVVIVSQDTRALDEFERLLTTLAGGLPGGEPELTIFFLKHAKAAAVAETLDEIFAGGTGSPGGAFSQNNGGGRGPSRGLPETAFGDVPGGTFDNLPGGETVERAGSVRITPDPRLNALIVQANRSDADTIEELLKILDQKQSPEEILAHAKPRIIAVHNTPAEDMADVIRQVYQDRMTGGSGPGAGQPPGAPQGPFQGPPGAPQQFFQQMAMFQGGGAGRRGGGQRGSSEELPRMSIGVDGRTNSLVVAAPDPLFREVKDLVGQLDRATLQSRDTVEVIALHGSDSGILRQALPALLGERVRFGQTSFAGRASGVPGVAPRGPAPQGLPGPQGLPAPGIAPQIGVVPGEPPQPDLPPGPIENRGMGVSRTGPGRAGPPEGPAEQQGMEAGPDGPMEAGPEQSSFLPQFPDRGGGAGADRRPAMEGGQPGPQSLFQRGSRGRTGVRSGSAPGGPGAPPR